MVSTLPTPPPEPPSFTSRHVLDPELRRIARVLPRTFALNRGLRVQRALVDFLGGMGERADVAQERVDDHVTVRIHRPAGRTGQSPVLLWLHGGGMVTGRARQDDPFCRRLAHLVGVTVVAVDYRLAPEHPYPVPLKDCYAALTWVARQTWADPARIAVAGGSAGGGLAAALSFEARDRGEVDLAAAALVYPMLDDRTPRVRTGRPRIMWSESDNLKAWAWYLDGADPELVAPARRTDLSGLPPTWIGCGSLDMFLEESSDYARRLEAADVVTRLEIASGAFHAFDQFAPDAAVTLRFFASLHGHLREHLIPTADDARS